MIPARALAILALPLLFGCPPKEPEAPLGPVDPARVLDRAERDALATPVLARFDVKLETPKDRVGANGTLLVDPEGRFRLELRGPIGGPAVVVASDGKDVVAWQAGPNVYYVAEDAEGALREATGDVAGLETLAAVLAGRLPDLGDPDDVAFDAEGRPRYVWKGPKDSRVAAVLDPRRARLVAVDVLDAEGRTWLSAQVEPADYPEAMTLVLPRQGVTAMLEFKDWTPAKPDASVYTFAAPEGAKIERIDVRKPVAPGDGGDTDTGAEPATGDPPPYVPTGDPSTGGTPPASPPTPSAPPPSP